MSTHVVILGARFGGLKLSSRLSAELADEVHVTLIDQSDSFIFGFSKLDVMFGRRTTDEVRIPYRDITRPGANFLSGPAPTALFTPPSLEGAEDKRRFAAFRRDRWFGPGSGESLPDGTTPDSPSPHEESHDHNLA